MLEVVERPARLQPDDEYQLLTVKRNREGVVARERLKGRDVLTKTQFFVRTGDFVISRRQIIHGACGVVPPELDGAIVSNEYAVLRPKPVLLLEYLRQLTHTPYFQRTCFHSSHGVDVEKMIFKLDRWFEYAIPLPPLDDQRRIAAVLSAIELHRATQSTVLSRLDELRAITIERHAQSARRRVPLGEAVDGIDSGWSPMCEQVPADEDEWGVLKVSAVTWGRFNARENKKLPVALTPRPDITVRAGDVLVSRANTPEFVGRSVFVRESYPRLMLSDKLLRLRAREGTMDARYLNAMLGSKGVREAIAGAATGSSSSMKNISQGALREILLPWAPLPQQQTLADVMDAVDRATAREEEVATRLAAMKASVAHRLLRGAA